MVDENVQVISSGKAVSPSNPMPVVKDIKGTTLTLFSGAIAASVTEENATEIDMTNSDGGSLEVTINSGTGTWSIAVMTHEVAGGVYVQMDKMKSDGSGFEDFPAIVTTASTSKSYAIAGIKANKLKFVPTLTGTCNATFKFTPAMT